MKNYLNESVAEFENTVQKIFECEQTIGQLQLQKANICAELLLVEHLLKAYDLINARGTD